MGMAAVAARTSSDFNEAMTTHHRVGGSFLMMTSQYLVLYLIHSSTNKINAHHEVPSSQNCDIKKHVTRIIQKDRAGKNIAATTPLLLDQTIKMKCSILSIIAVLIIALSSVDGFSVISPKMALSGVAGGE